MNNKFEVLKKEDVQLLFDQLKLLFGAVLNLYSTLTYSENALEAYIRLETSPVSLNMKEVEAVNHFYKTILAH